MLHAECGEKCTSVHRTVSFALVDACVVLCEEGPHEAA